MTCDSEYSPCICVCRGILLPTSPVVLRKPSRRPEPPRCHAADQGSADPAGRSSTPSQGSFRIFPPANRTFAVGRFAPKSSENLCGIRWRRVPLRTGICRPMGQMRRKAGCRKQIATAANSTRKGRGRRGASLRIRNLPKMLLILLPAHYRTFLRKSFSIYSLLFFESFLQKKVRKCDNWLDCRIPYGKRCRTFES